MKIKCLVTLFVIFGNVYSTQLVEADVLCERAGKLKFFKSESCPRKWKPIDFSNISNRGVVSAGQIGAKGDQGVKGDKGDVGVQGIQGLQGERGERGEIGFQGIQGLTGPVGPVGAVGPKGEQGQRGLQGERGFQGIQGIAGLPGARGPVGPQGPMGPQGLHGVPGIQGLRGDAGSKGEKGDPGAPAFFPPSDLTNGIAKFMTVKLNQALSLPEVRSQNYNSYSLLTTYEVKNAALLPCGKWFITRLSCQSTDAVAPAEAVVSRVKAMLLDSSSSGFSWGKAPFLSAPMENILLNTQAGPILSVLNHGYSYPLYFTMANPLYLGNPPPLLTLSPLNTSNRMTYTYNVCAANHIVGGYAQQLLLEGGLVTNTNIYTSEILSANMPCEIDVVYYQ